MSTRPEPSEIPEPRLVPDRAFAIDQIITATVGEGRSLQEVVEALAALGVDRDEIQAAML